MKHLSESNLHIIIVNGSMNKVCTGNCGTDWSSAEILGKVKQQVRDKFGNDIDISYIDLSKPAEVNIVRKLKSLVKDLSLPVLLVNDRVRIAGEFDFRQLMDVIETEYEVGMV